MLRVEIPPQRKAADGQVDRLRQDPLWDVDIERDSDGWIRAITWSGAEAPGYAFVKLDLIVSLPRLTGLQQIKIWQSYAGGSVVAWVEDRTAADVKRPAAGLLLTEGATPPPAPNGAAGPTRLAMALSAQLGGLIGGALVMVARRGRSGRPG